jgi:Zn-dependent peptidase ImmA (M78 family)/transcriptional regulator with XRE-family HTH domain
MKQHESIGRVVKRCRDKAGIDAELLAAAVGLDPSVLVDFEEGVFNDVPFRMVDALAQILGFDLLHPERGESAPIHALWKAHRDFALEPVDLPRLGNLARLIQEWVALDPMNTHRACFRDARARVGGPIALSGEAPAQGEQLAVKVRKKLGLDHAPILSLLALVDTLGVRRLHTIQLPDAVAGACLYDLTIGPTLLLNVNRPWWARRMAAAHELCHLLFDAVDGAALGRACRVALGRARPHDDAIEARANAFAIYFLAPRAPVLELAAKGGAAKPDARRLLAVMDQFGIGHDAATWHLFNLRVIDRERRAALLATEQRPDPRGGVFEEREVSEPRLLPPERRGALFQKALEAHQREVISFTRLAELLGVAPGRQLRELITRPTGPAVAA